MIGGVAYPVIIFIANSVDCSCGIQKFIYSGFVPFLLVGIGMFIGVKTHEKWGFNFFISLSVILVIYAFIKFYSTNRLDLVFEEEFIKFCIVSGIFGFAGAMIKVSSLKSKLPEFQVSKVQVYEQASSYRMHPVMRLLAGLMGSLFVFTPFWAFFSTREDKEVLDLSIAMYIIIALFILVCVGMGVFFLAYAIPGKTPKIILSYLKNQADE